MKVMRQHSPVRWARDYCCTPHPWAQQQCGEVQTPLQHISITLHVSFLTQDTLNYDMLCSVNKQNNIIVRSDYFLT